MKFARNHGQWNSNELYFFLNFFLAPPTRTDTQVRSMVQKRQRNSNLFVRASYSHAYECFKRKKREFRNRKMTDIQVAEIASKMYIQFQRIFSIFQKNQRSKVKLTKESSHLAGAVEGLMKLRNVIIV